MKTLENIVHKLIINGNLLYQPGLFHGKIGVAVFFFHYARHTGNKLFEDYAMNLIKNVITQINSNKIPTRYDIGVAGIGCGFEYILQKGFLEAENNEIFKEFDKWMCRAAMYEMFPNLNLPDGLTGCGRYFIFRLNGNGNSNDELHKALKHIIWKIINRIEKDKIFENEQPDVYRFFYDLTSLPMYAKIYSGTLQQCKNWECICKPDAQKMFHYMGSLQRLYVCQKYFNLNLSDEIEQEWKKWNETDHVFPMDIGFLNGSVSECLLYLTYYSQHDISWLNLL